MLSFSDNRTEVKQIERNLTFQIRIGLLFEKLFLVSISQKKLSRQFRLSLLGYLICLIVSMHKFCCVLLIAVVAPKK